MKSIFGALAILLVAFSSTQTQGQTQRLGIPPGNFTIEPRGSSVRDGFCMDLGVPAPAPSASLSHILTSPDMAIVKMGQREIKLQDAIREGLIGLEGHETTVGEILAPHPTESALSLEADLFIRFLKDGVSDATYEKWIKQLGPMTASEAASEIERIVRDGNVERAEQAFLETLQSVAEMGVGSGDGRRIRFVNKTDQPIQVEIREALVASETRMGTGDIDPGQFRAYRDSATWRDVQNDVWVQNAVNGLKDYDSTSAYFRSDNVRDPILSFQKDRSTLFALVRRLGEVQLRIVESGQTTSIVKGMDVAKRLDELSQKLVSENSTERVSFLHAGSVMDGKVAVQIGKQKLELDAVQIESALAGDSAALDPIVAAIPAGSRVVIWRDPFARGKDGRGSSYVEGARHVDPIELVVALQRRLGKDGKVFLDDEMDIGRTNAETLPGMSGAKDVVLITGAKDSFELNDKQAVSDIEELLNDAGIRVLKDVALDRIGEIGEITEANVLVLTGDKNQEFQALMNALASEGAFTGKFVVLLSCYQQGDEAFNSFLLNNQSQAKGFLFFKEKIDPAAVKSVLFQLSQIIEERGEAATESQFREWFLESVDRAKTDARGGAAAEAIEKLRDAVIQVSSLSLSQNRYVA